MKKYFWIAALIAALAFVMAGCNVGVVGEGGGEGGEEGGETITIDLPLEFTADTGAKSDVTGGATQKGWCTNGTDDVVTTLKMADLKAARYLVLELAAAPSGGMQLIWQGDGNSWGWDQQDGILNNDGTPNAAKGAKFRGESRAADNTVLEIELSKAMKNYNSLKACTQAKFFIGYYSPDIAGLGITKAYLEIIKGGAPPPPATVTSVAVTPATATIAQGATRQYTAAVEGENNPKNTVRWTISGTGLKAGTTISAAGLLTVAADEPVGTEITVTATSTVDKTKSGSAVVTVVDAIQLSDGFSALGDFTDGKKEWSVSEADLTAAKYLIVQLHTDELNGSSGLQLAHQGGTNWDWKEVNLTGDWTGLQPDLGSYGANLDFYIVIELSTIPDWDKTSGGGNAKIILNSPEGWTDSNFEFVAGYLSTKVLTKPSPSVDVKKDSTTYGWFAVAVPGMFVE